MVLAVRMITKRHLATVVFLATLIASTARADGPDISAGRLLSSWRDENPGMRRIAEVIASAFASGSSMGGEAVGKRSYCAPPDLKGPQINDPSQCQTCLASTVIDRVAKDLGEDVDFLFDVAIEMEPEDGLLWVLSLGDESVMAFTDDGVDSLVELIKIHREMPPRDER
jgi:hypothetical protein